MYCARSYVICFLGEIMSELLTQFVLALKARKLILAAEIEATFIQKANLIENWEMRDMWIENLTLLSI